VYVTEHQVRATAFIFQNLDMSKNRAPKTSRGGTEIRAQFVNSAPISAPWRFRERKNLKKSFLGTYFQIKKVNVVAPIPQTTIPDP
jgi:hypothetical protein